MRVEQFDIEVAGQCVARVVTRGQRYVLYAMLPALHDFDGQVFDTLAEAREAAILALEADSSDAAEEA